MAFEVADFQDLIQLLREHPDWRDELRTLLLTQELLTLPALMLEAFPSRRASTVL
jgi:hypothetical protein